MPCHRLRLDHAGIADIRSAIERGIGIEAFEPASGARHANAMAQELYAATAELPAVKHLDPPPVNGLFPVLVPEVIQPLRDWSFFWDWDLARDQVRWMTALDTTTEDVEAFAAGVRASMET